MERNPQLEENAREHRHDRRGHEQRDARRQAPPPARGSSATSLRVRSSGRSKAEARVVDEFEMIAVAPALPDQHGLVLRQKLGDREAERLAGEARIQPRVASSDEICDALPIARARQMDDAFMGQKTIGVEQHQPQILATLQRRLDRPGDERHVELVARAVSADHERIRWHAELRAQIRSRRRRIDDVRNGGIARPGRRFASHEEI